jgi:hypothetical protein
MYKVVVLIKILHPNTKQATWMCLLTWTKLNNILKYLLVKK